MPLCLCLGKAPDLPQKAVGNHTQPQLASPRPADLQHDGSISANQDRGHAPASHDKPLSLTHSTQVGQTPASQVLPGPGLLIAGINNTCLPLPSDSPLPPACLALLDTLQHQTLAAANSLIGLWLLDEASNEFVVVHSLGPESKAILPIGSSVQVPESASGFTQGSPSASAGAQLTSVAAMVSTKVPIAKSTARSDNLPPDWQLMHANHRFTHFAAVPLFSGAILRGMLTIYCRGGPLADSASGASGAMATPTMPAELKGIRDQAQILGAVLDTDQLGLLGECMSLCLFSSGSNTPQLLCGALQAILKAISLTELVSALGSTIVSYVQSKHCIELSAALALTATPLSATAVLVEALAPAAVQGEGEEEGTHSSNTRSPLQCSSPKPPAFGRTSQTATGGAAARLNPQRSMSCSAVSLQLRYSAAQANISVSGPNTGKHVQVFRLRDTLLQECLSDASVRCQPVGLVVADCRARVRSAGIIPKDILVLPDPLPRAALTNATSASNMSIGQSYIPGCLIVCGSAVCSLTGPALGVYLYATSMLPAKLLAAAQHDVEQLLQALSPALAARLGGNFLQDVRTLLGAARDTVVSGSSTPVQLSLALPKVRLTSTSAVSLADDGGIGTHSQPLSSKDKDSGSKDVRDLESSATAANSKRRTLRQSSRLSMGSNAPPSRDIGQLQAFNSGANNSLAAEPRSHLYSILDSRMADALSGAAEDAATATEAEQQFMAIGPSGIDTGMSGEIPPGLRTAFMSSMSAQQQPSGSTNTNTAGAAGSSSVTGAFIRESPAPATITGTSAGQTLTHTEEFENLTVTVADVDTHGMMQTQVEALYSSLTSAMHSIRPPSGASSAPNSGAAHRALPPPPSELSHLVLHEVMGRGGGGVVLRATQWGLECAVKVFDYPEHMDEPLPQCEELGTAEIGATIELVSGALNSASRAGSEPATPRSPNPGAEKMKLQRLHMRRTMERAAMELAVCSAVSHPMLVQVYAHHTRVRLLADESQPAGFRLVLASDPASAAAGTIAPSGDPACSEVCLALVMEFCDMGGLDAALTEGRLHRAMQGPQGAPVSMPNMQLIYMTLVEVALALRHLHAHNIAHCDIKPGNVLLRSCARDKRGFTSKLADFGFAKLLTPGKGPGGRPGCVPEDASGTLPFMAPELFIKGAAIDASVDIYAFGILMYCMYTARAPYTGVAEQDLPRAVVTRGLRPELPVHMPSSYRSLAARCWSRDPLKRPSATELAHVLSQQLALITAGGSPAKGNL